MKPSRLLLIDGHSLIYRAYYAIRGLSTSKGLPTNAALGFTNMLLRVIREKDPDFLAVAFDAKGPTQRHEEYEDYKANRPEMPEALQQQIPLIHRIVAALNIHSLMIEGIEADDLIGTLSRQAEAKGLEVIIVTGDKDLFQLISPKTRIYDSMKDKFYDQADVLDRFGVEPARIVEIMGLMGDSIDNIPGVPGIGEKTAIKLIRQFETIDNLLGHLDQVSQNKLRESLKANGDQARMSRELATLKLDCPVKLNLEELKRKQPEISEVTELFQELEFSNLLKKVQEMAGTEAHNSSGGSLPEISVESISTPEALGRMIRKVREDGEMAIEPWPKDAWAGLSISLIDQSFYIPMRYDYLRAPGQLKEKQVLEQLAPLLKDSSIKKTGHGLKEVLLACLKSGFSLSGLHFDTEIAAYLLNPNRRDHSLETCAFEVLGHPLTPLPKTDTPEQVTIEEIAEILAGRGHLIFQLSTKFKDLLANQDLLSLLRDVEMPLITVLANMEHVGIKIDVESLREISKELGGHLEKMMERIYSLAGGKFNINSPKQLSDILFNRIGLKPIKRTKTGYSTNEEVLQQLGLEHELPAEILIYRQLNKLKSTYADALPELVHPETGRLHTTFNQTVTATGRLSSSDPNLQNIPIKGEWGRRIRSAFVAENGFQLMSFDYNQIELRILAHLSGDEKLLADFKEGHDVHRSTASKIFGLPEADISAEMRRTAKTVNFGIVYGISPYGLSTTLSIPQTEAKAYIDSYFTHYSGVKQFIDQTIEEASKRGFVTTLFHRRRPIPELASPDRAGRSLGERTAVNTVIQGSAADLIKLAMIRISEKIQETSLKSRMLLQIHDELLFETPDDQIENSQRLITREMEGVLTLGVPLKVDIGIGENWNTAHP